MTNAEEQVWIASGGVDLYGMAHVPAGQAAGAVVFCNPIFEERKSANRALVEAARQFSRDGLAVLRFDYRGCGDSGGSFEAFSVSDWMEDVGRAVQWTRGRFPGAPVSLLGLRLGGALALRAAADAGAAALALWEPVSQGLTYLEDELRRKLMKEMLTFGRQQVTREDLLRELRAGGKIDFDGYAVTARLYEGLGTLEVPDIVGAYRGPCLLAHINHQDRPTPAMQNCRDQLEKAGLKVDFRTVVMQPFWSLIGYADCAALITETSQWLVKSRVQ